MKIALISSEAVPYSKTGGLADVAGTLYREYIRMGLDVSLFVPLYKTTSVKFADSMTDTGISLDIPVGSDIQKCRLFRLAAKGSPPDARGQVYFISNADYFDREELYGPPEGDYPDNAARFAFFSKSVLEVCRKLKLKFDVLHCNDWQTGLIPLYIEALRLREKLFEDTRTMFTIHNLGYQGLFPPSALDLTGLGPDHFTPEGIEFYGNINLLKAGIISADMVTTVSQTYAKEILTPDKGFGLDGVLRTRKDALYGVLNGIDYNEWNPAADPALPASYAQSDAAGKKICKQALISHCGFTGKSEMPILSFIGRLSEQKGIVLLAGSINELMRRGLKLFILGRGDAHLEKLLRDYAGRYPGDIFFVAGFDDRLAHLAYAGSDIFLMPSVYEPCGLGQMIAMRYGTVPVATNTGGLADSITAETNARQDMNGFLFNEHSLPSFTAGINSALQAYGNRKVWAKIVCSAMGTDFSWPGSAAKYLELYKGTAHNG